ncbi:MAG TPA: class I SAM-dependent methyltransferase [Gaiellaceae bacterium]
MRRISDPSIVGREYATTERLAARRLDRTAWLRGEEPWRVALQAIAEIHPKRVLDAGCGNGDFAALIAAPEVMCVDVSEGAVAKAREHGLRAEVADIERLPFADGSLDVVTCNWVLYHLTDLDAGLAEIVRLLRPSRRFVGIYNHPDHLAELWRLVTDSVWDEDFFGCKSGPAVLRRHFRHVECRDAVGKAMWATKEAAQAFLDAFAELAGPLTAPEGPYPLEASRRNCVLVADV